MEINFEVKYHEDVVKNDIPSLPVNDRDMIKRAIETRLMRKPEIYGKPLRKSLKGYRKLRVGDYRIVFRIEEENGLIKIFIIQNRKAVYKNVTARIEK